MAGRWELMKAAWKERKPVSTAEIVSDVRAATIKALQPAVSAGERFREAHPEAAEKISRTAAAGQIRESVQLRKDISTSKHNVTVAKNKVTALGSRIESAPIRNGVFVGTDSQFNQYQKDVRNYNTNVNRFNSENKRIASLEGKKLYPTLERMVSKRIPTLRDVSRKGAAFRRKHPTVAAGIYKTFDRAHAKTERVGTDSQRSALAGYTYGSYDSLQKKPVKTVASFAVGGASAKAVKMIGLVGKAYGAGTKAKRMAQAAQLGILAYYGTVSTAHIMSAPNAYEAGKRAADIMYTEILPMSVGVKAATVGPKVAKMGVQRGRASVRQFKVNLKNMAECEAAMAKPTKLKTHFELPKTKIQSDITYEQFIKQQNIGKGVLSKSEHVTLQKSVARSVRISRAKAAAYKAKSVARSARTRPSGKKADTIATVKNVEEANTFVRGVKNVKSSFEKVSKMEPLETQIAKLSLKQQRLDKKFEIGQIEWNTYIKQSKVIEKKVSESIKFYEDVFVYIEPIKLAQPRFRTKPIPKTQAKPVVGAEVKTKVETATKVKHMTVHQFAQHLATAIAVAQLFKRVHKQTHDLAPLVAAKPKAKPTPKPNRKKAPLISPTPKPTTDVPVTIPHVKKETTKTKPTTIRVPRTKTPRIPRAKIVFPLVPPVLPPFKRKAKKKPARKDKQIVTYTPIQFKNRVATIESLFG